MRLRQLITMILLTACVLMAQAVAPRLQASLVTCMPGPEIYELEGHEAIRIHGVNSRGEAMDSVWNYGVFDFNTPGFIYRFVRGETDYMVWGYPFEWFMPQYVERGSKVVEQQLNLTEEETLRLLRLLQTNALPANRTYRYNYVRDNCSTRVAVMLDSAVAPRRIIYPDSVSYLSFRDAMRHYHRNYPWYQFGIDLVLGSGIDHPLTARQEIFAPLRFMDLASEARFSGDDSPLVSRTTVLNEGMADATLPATPWYLTPMAMALVVMTISFGVAFWEWRNRKIARWWMTIFFTALGLTGCIVWFLVFFSSHDSTSPNLLCLWLSPLQLVLALCVWWRVTRPAAMAMATVNLIVMILLVCIWPLQPQVTNMAVFPLWAATLVLCAVYALLYPALRERRVADGYLRHSTVSSRGSRRNNKRYSVKR